VADQTSTEDKAAPADGAEKDAAAAKPASGPGLKGLLISTVIMAVIMGGVGFALAYFVLPGRLQASSSAPAPAAAPAGTTTAAAPATPAIPVPPTPTNEKTTLPLDETNGKLVTKFTVEEITVNIADTKGNRFVRAGVYFDADQPVLEELEANRPRIIDTVGQVLSTKTLDELTSPNIRGTLRDELMGIINPTLKAGHIDNLYFTDLLVQ
jgi:flagellar FliL protein